jgi:hypothetical protein
MRRRCSTSTCKTKHSRPRPTITAVVACQPRFPTLHTSNSSTSMPHTTIHPMPASLRTALHSICQACSRRSTTRSRHSGAWQRTSWPRSMSMMLHATRSRESPTSLVPSLLAETLASNSSRPLVSCARMLPMCTAHSSWRSWGPCCYRVPMRRCTRRSFSPTLARY